MALSYQSVKSLFQSRDWLDVGLRKIIGRIKYNPLKYSDNPGAQFLLELHNHSPETLKSFILRYSMSEDPKRMEMTETEEDCLVKIKSRCHMAQQIGDATYLKGGAAFLTSRRAFIYGLSVAAAAGFKGLMSWSTRFSEEEIAEWRKLAERRKALEKNMEQQPEELPADATPEQREAHEAVEKEREEYNRDVEAANERYKRWFQRAWEHVDDAFTLENAGFILLAIGLGWDALGHAKVVTKQVDLKFEQNIQKLDEFVDYRLNRTLHDAPKLKWQAKVKEEKTEQASAVVYR